MASRSTVGDISRPNEVRWKIENYFALRQLGDTCMVSPTFSFCGVTCLFAVYTYELQNEEVWTQFYLQVEEIYDLEVGVYIEIGLKCDATMYKSSRRKIDSRIKYGIKFDLPPSDLRTKRDVIAPGGALTVYCNMSLDDDSAKPVTPYIELITKREFRTEASSQTEPPSKGVDKLLHDFGQLLLGEDGSDVTINVRGQEFRAHRYILGARTPVFSSMFKCEIAEKTTGLVTIEDCEPEIFKEFLHYLYVGSVKNMSLETAFDLYSVADKYQVTELKMQCLDFMENSLSLDTICKVLTVALLHSETELLRKATDFFVGKMKEIIKTVGWQRFLIEYPIAANELFIKAVDSEDGKQRK